jgi:hypothetical protein
MQAVLDSLRTFFSSLLHSPHHLMAYTAIVAVLLVTIPLARVIFASHGSDEDTSSLASAPPSMLGLASASADFTPASIEFTPPAESNVTAINESLTAPCIHCGVTISSREDFCPACGYAQPVKQSFIAAFPA